MLSQRFFRSSESVFSIPSFTAARNASFGKLMPAGGEIRYETPGKRSSPRRASSTWRKTLSNELQQALSFVESGAEDSPSPSKFGLAYSAELTAFLTEFPHARDTNRELQMEQWIASNWSAIRQARGR